MLTHYLYSLFLFTWLAAGSASWAVTPPIPDQPPGHVVDLAGVIDAAQKQQLDQILRELEQKTTDQVVVLTITSLENEDINTVSLRTAEKWQIGQKDKDNGLLFTIALQDKKYRFETGYGLESVLPDSLLGTLGRKTMVPYFREGKYGQGIAAATGEIVNILARNSNVTITGTEQLPQPIAGNNQQQGNYVIFFIMLVMFIIIVNARRKNRRSPGVGPIIFPGGWGTGGGFGGGGGGFGGGFGGGGGGFGGGGASGGW
jgi:uncharacterized protein